MRTGGETGESVTQSKWPEQEPQPGETRFDFALRMALTRRRNDEAMSSRRRELGPGWVHDLSDERARMGRPKIIRE